MVVVTITSKGQMTIPKEVRDALDLRAGDKVEIKVEDGTFSARPRRKRSLFEIRKERPMLKSDRGVTVDGMNQAIGDGAVERYERTRR